MGCKGMGLSYHDNFLHRCLIVNPLLLKQVCVGRNKFAFLEVCEILLRYYQPEPSRLRPTDRMVAHTGFLLFARKIEPSADPRGVELAAEAGLSNKDERD